MKNKHDPQIIVEITRETSDISFPKLNIGDKLILVRRKPLGVYARGSGREYFLYNDEFKEVNS